MSQPTYFVDHKRGEVNELKALLRNPKVNKEPAKKREVIKKVIAYMTLGIDVSRIFSEMVMAASTKDLVQKKMVYHYLCSYAAQNSDLALLAINTLQKDCADEDPMVRGLALRSLCSLRLPNIVEYVLLPIRNGLRDQSPYVRKTAVLGCAKLFQIAPATIKESDLVDVLYNMLRDKDPTVIGNVICSLNEILLSEGGMAVNQQIVMYLLNRIKEFNEWGQCIVLELVAKYTPASNDEMFDIMNLLEDRLKHSNSAVVLGTTKVFLFFTKNLPTVHKEVYKRLKSPLLTLMGGGTFEQSFAVLGQIALLVERAPGVFDDSYKHFYSRFNDPSWVKLLKLNILTNLANEQNFGEILGEVSEYVTDVDSDIARNAIRGLGKTAIKIDQAVDQAIEHLLSFLELNSDYISAETCIVLKDVLRKYPERYEEVIPALQKCLKTIEETEGKAAVLWMIGEYGEYINDSPYILEPLIDSFGEEASSVVRMELLTAAMKLFFKRPGEMKSMLGRLLNTAISDVAKVDVRDRALMYYRLLRLDVQEAARVVNCPKVIVDVFAESKDVDLKEQIFREFNTLSVVYTKPAEKFITKVVMPDLEQEAKERKEKKAHEQKVAELERDDPLPEEKDAGDDDIEDGGSAGASGASGGSASGGSSGSGGSSAGASGNSEHKAPQKNQDVDLLSMDSILTPDFDASSGYKAPETAPPAYQLELTPRAAVDVKTFQTSWGSLPAAANFSISAPGVEQKALEARLVQNNISTMASGNVQGVLKLYVYGRDARSLFLIELVYVLATSQATVTIKTDSTEPEAVPQLTALVKQCLGA